MSNESRIGRPRGSRTFDPIVAVAFGLATRRARMARGMAQERLARDAAIEASHLGRVERGESAPTLSTILKIARGLQCRASELVDEAERLSSSERALVP